VATLVMGHFMQERGALRVTIEAVDVGTNRVVWRDAINVPSAMRSRCSVARGARARWSPAGAGCGAIIARRSRAPGERRGMPTYAQHRDVV
jgi:hypothetical protein